MKIASPLIAALSLANAIASFFGGDNNAGGAWVISTIGWALLALNEYKQSKDFEAKTCELNGIKGDA